MKKETNKHSKSKWKNKLILTILTTFIIISKVNAVSLGSNKYAPDYVWENTNKIQPIYEVVSNLQWWGHGGYAEKWSFEYDNLNLDNTKRYTVSGALYFQNSVPAFSTPVVSISNIFCSIENTYNYNYQIMKDYELDNQNVSEVYEWSNYGTNISQLLSFTCENVPIEVPISYLNVLFSSNMGNVRITELSILESTSSSITQQQQETNKKLEEFIESDLSEEDKQKPNQDGYNSYEQSENELKNKMQQADLNNISIGIDANSSTWIWETLTRLIQSHTVVFGMFIAILSIGIIKLALGR